MIRRAGFIGDVHAEDERLEAALRFLEAEGCDTILCAGDVMTGLGNVNRCVELLERANTVTVKGNHDRWMIQQGSVRHSRATDPATVKPATWSYLTALPAAVSLATASGQALLCHGLGDDDMAALRPDDYGYALEANFRLQAIVGEEQYKFVLAGHTHKRMVRTIENVTFINAGTLRADQEPCFCTVDFETMSVQFYDITNAANISRAENLLIV